MKKSVFLLLFLALAAFFPAPTNAQDASAIAFVNVNVIPMDRERVLRNQTVVVRNDEIAPRFQHALDKN